MIWLYWCLYIWGLLAVICVLISGFSTMDANVWNIFTALISAIAAIAAAVAAYKSACTARDSLKIQEFNIYLELRLEVFKVLASWEQLLLNLEKRVRHPSPESNVKEEELVFIRSSKSVVDQSVVLSEVGNKMVILYAQLDEQLSNQTQTFDHSHAIYAESDHVIRLTREIQESRNQLIGQCQYLFRTVKSVLENTAKK